MDRLTCLEEVTRHAGDLLMDYFQHPLEIRWKSKLDLVTAADLASERFILDRIHEHFPSDEILAEESGARDGRSGFRWIIDPLDGTTNFSHGFPHFAVSIALEQNGTLVAGAVYDPAKKEFFHASHKRGAFLGENPLKISSITDSDQALAVSGFPYDRRTHLPELLSRVERALNHFQGFRRLGAAALDLAYIAAGRFDMFWETGLKPWDLAAGVLLIREAGGHVTGLSGDSFSLERGDILTANPHLHAKALKVFFN